MIKDIILYVLTVIAFIITSQGIVNGKKVVAICGALAMAVLTGCTFYM